MNAPSRDLKAFIVQCAQGDPDARSAFQQAYGTLIYTFPVRIFHLSEDEAGNFYLYVFEKDRIFKRLLAQMPASQRLTTCRRWGAFSTSWTLRKDLS